MSGLFWQAFPDHLACCFQGPSVPFCCWTCPVLWVCRIKYVHLSVDEHLGSFCFLIVVDYLLIVNNTAVNIHVHVLVNLCFNFSWRCTHTHEVNWCGSCGHSYMGLYRMFVQKPFANFQLDYCIIKLLESFLCNLNTSSLTDWICNVVFFYFWVIISLSWLFKKILASDRSFHFDDGHMMCFHFIACVFSIMSETIATFNITKICFVFF